MNTPILREARSSDLKAIQDLNYALFKHDAGRDPNLNLNWPYEDGEMYFRRMIAGEIGVCYVAESEGTIIGYLAGSIKIEQPTYRPVKLAELENIFVLPKDREAGIGTLLTNKFIAFAKQNGAARVKVEAYASNTGAINFYEKVGFKPYSLIMEIDLDESQ